MKNFENLLSKTSKKPAEQNENDSLASKITKFDKADEIMLKLNIEKKEEVRDKIEYVTYAIPESYLKLVNDIIKKCMREEISINKSEIVRLGIHMVADLNLQDLTEKLNEVKILKGRPKKN